MRSQCSQNRCKRRRRRVEDGEQEASRSRDNQPSDEPERLGAFYSSGPMLRLDACQSEVAAQHPQARSTSAQEKSEPEQPTATALPAIQGIGSTHQVTVHGQALRLQGRTDANFSSSFRTQNVRTQSSIECKDCANSNCVHVTGTLVATYSVNTTVTLPSARDFPDLTPCQHTRVKQAISNVLAPHEKQHVVAFRQYNGVTRQRFDLTLCRSDFDSTIRAMFEAEEQDRQAAAKAASDVLDPFHFDVDLNCEKQPQK